MPATLTKRILFCWHAVISISLAASTLLMTLTFAPASAASTGGMSCCPNGSSTHCSSGMEAVAEPAPEPEPTCGHEVLPEVDEITIVAEENVEDSQPDSSASNSSNQVFTASLNAPCTVDCCTLAWSTVNRSNRDLRGLVDRKADSLTIIIQSKVRPSAVLRHASQAFNRATPRGPPSR
jgi:hypothetical protein